MLLSITTFRFYSQTYLVKSASHYNIHRLYVTLGNQINISRRTVPQNGIKKSVDALYTLQLTNFLYQNLIQVLV